MPKEFEETFGGLKNNWRKSFKLHYNKDERRRRRKGHYDRVKRFTYSEDDISNLPLFSFEGQITISVHPCKTADLIVDLWNKSKSPVLILMPCCKATYPDVIGFSWLETKMSKYDVWTYHLAQKIQNAKVKVTTDKYILSPCGNIIVAERNL